MILYCLFFLVRACHRTIKSQTFSDKTSSPNYGTVFIMESLLNTKIYVGNLGYSVSDETLAEKFQEFGTVKSAKIIMDRDTNRSKGFGFVEMSTGTEAANAISKLNGLEFDGRKMNVTEAKPMAPRESRPTSRRY